MFSAYHKYVIFGIFRKHFVENHAIMKVVRVFEVTMYTSVVCRYTIFTSNCKGPIVTSLKKTHLMSLWTIFLWGNVPLRRYLLNKCYDKKICHQWSAWMIRPQEILSNYNLHAINTNLSHTMDEKGALIYYYYQWGRNEIFLGEYLLNWWCMSQWARFGTSIALMGTTISQSFVKIGSKTKFFYY